MVCNSIRFGAFTSGSGLPLLLGKMDFAIPGGIGFIENNMTTIYNGMGIISASTIVVVLGYRLISFWIPILPGFPIASFLQRSRRISDE